ncbi:4081_t:CDS:2 [Paraglomus brasilianum]|uniref:4081_t:CDS:1 n=1 Tax=Paraglomus brasilianum TaxID=144538 RepID=A0A9N9B497_9GLOM|nr:4081_t:CDS:2 [Paraglomus brasilianum]
MAIEIHKLLSKKNRLAISTIKLLLMDNNPTEKSQEKSVRIDLTKELPKWPYTVYAPAKEEPNLIEGTDVSPEELRFEFFKLKDSWMYGGDMQYNQGVSQLNSVMKQKIDDVLKDLRNSLRTYQKMRRQSGNSSNTFGNRTQSRNTSQQPPNTFRSNGGLGQPQQNGAFVQQRLGGSGFDRQQQGGFGSSRFSQQNNYGGFGQQQPSQPSPFGQQPGPGFGATQPNGGYYQQQPQQTELGLGTLQQPPQQSNTFGTFSVVGNPPVPTFGHTGIGSAPNIQQQHPLGQSIQYPFGAQQQPSLFRGGIQDARPDIDSSMVGMSEYFTGQVPTSPPTNHY